MRLNVSNILNIVALWALNASPKSAFFLRVALIKAGVRGAGVIRAILKRECHVFEKLIFLEIWYIASLACTLSF